MDLGGVRNLRSYFCPAIHSPERDSHDCQVADLVNAYKASVQAEPATANGELKHFEWDGWAVESNTSVYVVFDPTDSAAAKSHQPGKHDGIPCAAHNIHRARYAVVFAGLMTFRCGRKRICWIEHDVHRSILSADPQPSHSKCFSSPFAVAGSACTLAL